MGRGINQRLRKMVFEMIEHGRMRKTDNDRLEDFVDLYDFEQVFDLGYVIDTSQVFDRSSTDQA